MREFKYTVQTDRSFNDAVAAVEQKTAEKGFRVLHVHDVAATLGEKGFNQEPLKIIEICNARYAHEALQKDISTALMLPCPIAVFSERGNTYISTMLPSVLVDLFPGKGIDFVAAKVEEVVLQIVNEAKG